MLPPCPIIQRQRLLFEALHKLGSCQHRFFGAWLPGSLFPAGSLPHWTASDSRRWDVWPASQCGLGHSETAAWRVCAEARRLHQRKALDSDVHRDWKQDHYCMISGWPHNAVSRCAWAPAEFCLKLIRKNLSVSRASHTHPAAALKHRRQAPGI